MERILREQSISKVFAAARPALELVENKISKELGSEAPVLTEISSYLLNLGGKRIRPLLASLSSELFGMQAPSPQLIDAAAGIELIHMATLLHDDIIDQSAVRRGKPSALSAFGLAPTLLTGDFLLVKAFGLCGLLDSFIVERTKRACVELTEGEVLEGQIDSTRRPSLSEYRIIVEKKTASLFSLAMAVGAHLAGATDDEVSLAERFGSKAGVAFQMVDDILDVSSEETELGKPLGADLKQRTPSLVNLLWLESGDPKASVFFSSPSHSPDEVLTTALYLRDSEILAQAADIACESAEEAKTELRSLSGLARSESIDSLLSVVDYSIYRAFKTLGPAR